MSVRDDHDPDGLRLPIKIDTTSNGEFLPIPLSKANRLGNRSALDAATTNAKRVGRSRRNFLMSSCGAATTLLAMNQVNAAAGKLGGYFQVPADAAFDEQLAQASLGGEEFIFDVQGHYVDPTGKWLEQVPDFARPFAGMPKADCEAGEGSGTRSYLECLGPDEFVKDVFMDSDTDMMVLSFVPSAPDAEPVTIEAADSVRRIVDEMEGTHRLMLHGRVNPNQAGDVERMDSLANDWGVSAWKTYTQFGPGGGYWLTDDDGLEMIEKARDLGVKVICIHKGLPLSEEGYEYSTCRDVGAAAKQFPDVTFIIYHSGYVAGQPESAFEPGAGRDGIDTLIQSLVDHDLGPGSNVYAELGSTWRFLMREPDHAAHAMGKLLKYVGEDNVLWGTDSIWYGSPQDQIQAFRSFQIAEPLREAHGYPEITPELRAKVFGLNATKPYGISAEEVKLRAGADKISHARAAYAGERNPSYATYGPKTRREFFNLLRSGAA